MESKQQSGRMPEYLYKVIVTKDGIESSCLHIVANSFVDALERLKAPSDADKVEVWAVGLLISDDVNSVSGAEHCENKGEPVTVELVK